jgi:hypothetical protein
MDPTNFNHIQQTQRLTKMGNKFQINNKLNLKTKQKDRHQGRICDGNNKLDFATNFVAKQIFK